MKETRNGDITLALASISNCPFGMQFATLPAGTEDAELIRVAGTRWPIEECFKTAKGQVGLDEYQVRRYDAWCRHITLPCAPTPASPSPPRQRERPNRHNQ